MYSFPTFKNGNTGFTIMMMYENVYENVCSFATPPEVDIIGNFLWSFHGNRIDKNFRSDFAYWLFILKGQSHQDLAPLENPMKVLLLIGNPIIIA